MMAMVDQIKAALGGPEWSDEQLLEFVRTVPQVERIALLGLRGAVDCLNGMSHPHQAKEIALQAVMEIVKIRGAR